MNREHLWWMGWVVISTLIILLIPVREAHAYLDPGSGSFLLQAAIAAGLGLLLSARLFWRRLFKRPSDAPEADEE